MKKRKITNSEGLITTIIGYSNNAHVAFPSKLEQEARLETFHIARRNVLDWFETTRQTCEKSLYTAEQKAWVLIRITKAQEIFKGGLNEMVEKALEKELEETFNKIQEWNAILKEKGEIE